MTFEIKRNRLITAVAAALMLPAMSAHAGGTITFGEDKSVSIGLGMRGSFSSVENGAPNGTSRSQDFSLDSARIYLSGSLNKTIKGMLNTEKDIAGQGFQAIDANELRSAYGSNTVEPVVLRPASAICASAASFSAKR